MTRFTVAILIVLSFVLVACGQTQADTLKPTDVPADVAPDTDTNTDTDMTDEEPADAAQAPVDADLNPDALEPDTFTVTVYPEDDSATLVLEPLEIVNEGESGVFGSFFYNDIHNYYTLQFVRIYPNKHGGYSTEDVSFRLPKDIEPGTHTIEGSELLSSDFTIVAASVPYLGDMQNWTIYSEYSGTLTITAMENDAISGTFTLVAKDPNTGQTATATGVFNQVDEANWYNKLS